MRGTLGLDRSVPVGFQQMTCTTRARVPAGTDPRLLRQLQAHAQRSCVNLDTLRRGVPVTTRTQLDSAGDPAKPLKEVRMRPPT